MVLALRLFLNLAVTGSYRKSLVASKHSPQMAMRHSQHVRVGKLECLGLAETGTTSKMRE